MEHLKEAVKKAIEIARAINMRTNWLYQLAGVIEEVISPSGKTSSGTEVKFTMAFSDNRSQDILFTKAKQSDVESYASEVAKNLNFIDKTRDANFEETVKQIFVNIWNRFSTKPENSSPQIGSTQESKLYGIPLDKLEIWRHLRTNELKLIDSRNNNQQVSLRNERFIRHSNNINDVRMLIANRNLTIYDGVDILLRDKKRKKETQIFSFSQILKLQEKTEPKHKTFQEILKIAN